MVLPGRAEIVRCLSEAGRALHAREIAGRLAVREGSYSELQAVLDRLCLDGLVKRLAGNRFRAEQRSAPESWEGLLAVNPRGFGFVSASGHEDVYVAWDGLGGAVHGDRVLVSVVARSARGIEGRVEQVVERRSPRVAGVLRRRGRSLWLEPDDARIRGPIVIQAASGPARDGEAAVVSITRFPSYRDENPEAELVRVLGVPGDPKVELGKILEREDLAGDYPLAALAEAEEKVRRIDRSRHTRREDLTGIALPAIDPEDARDHDDAIWAERVGDGYRLWVAIADVAEFVEEGGALDGEAQRRGCSVYLPDRVIPMLPQVLSSEACSLLPGQPRLCLFVRAELDARARVRSFEVGEGTMCSAASLSYPEVARTLGWTSQGEPSPASRALRAGLLVMDEIAKKLRGHRLRRGALDFELPEPQVLLDGNTGGPLQIDRRASDPGVRRAYRVVEEFMLLANELVANWLGERDAPTIYRIHAEPDPAKLERLGEIAVRLGAPFDLERMSTTRGVSRWLSELAEHPRRGVLEMLLLRSLKQASYDTTNVGHFGLASPAYLHFTSPIRRYPDLVVHRKVKSLLALEPPDRSEAAQKRLALSASSASARERAAAEVEREVVDLYRALLMRGRIGHSLEGTVSGVGPNGLYVTLDQPFVDVLVPMDSLGTGFEVATDETAVNSQRSGERIELGDRMVVSIQDVSVVRRIVTGRHAC